MTERPYKNLDPLDLMNEIDQQKRVVDLCVTFAEKIALDPDNETDLQGLYFAVLRHQQLTEELELRYRDQIRSVKAAS